MTRKILSDQAITTAVETRFGQLSVADQIALTRCTDNLRRETRGMGQMIAREVLFHIGRLLVEAEKRNKVH